MKSIKTKTDNKKTIKRIAIIVKFFLKEIWKEYVSFKLLIAFLDEFVASWIAAWLTALIFCLIKVASCWVAIVKEKNRAK